MVYINGRMVIVLKENGSIALSTVKAQISSLMVMYSQVSTIMANLRARASISGKMEVSILVSSRMASNMAKENGRNGWKARTAIDSRETTRMIRKMVLASSFGSLATTIRAVTKTMSVMDMERCFGTMEAITKVSGLMGSRTVLAVWNFQMAE